MKKILFTVILILIASAGILAYLMYPGPDPNAGENRQSRCLSENEYAEYFVNKENPDDRVAKIYVKDRLTQEVLKEFEIEIIDPKHYRPVEIHKCAVYAIRDFNFDWKAFEVLPGFSRELWLYDYLGTGEKKITFSELKNGEEIFNYSSEFRISPNEKYISLVKGHGEDQSFVIKDLETQEDVYTLSMKDAIESHDLMPGTFSMGYWTEKPHLWLGIQIGAGESGYIRINTENWETDILPAPDDIQTGVEGSLNQDKGYLAYTDLVTFTGFAPTDQEILEEAIKAGKKKNLFVYNLFTREKTQVDSVEIVQDHNFNLSWISDTELEYYLPSGERRVYRLN